MKRITPYLCTLVVLLTAVRLQAQLSAGPLSNAHQGLEGLSNCTKCHEIGNKVSNSRCLECHSEIKSRIDQNRGYHATSEVRSKECAQCHSDHHGRKFDMVRFDEKNFNHNATGYELTGKHRQIDCRACHQPNYVADAGLKKRSETFLGLQQQCLSCHDDYHQKTLSKDCASCHQTDAFAPASKFRHEKTRFALLGKHRETGCVECHPKETRNGADFQRFAGVAFNSCVACHQDPHQNHLGTNCKECHVEQSFEQLASLKSFNHQKTGFPLKGRHRQTDCAACHQMATATPATVFQDRINTKTNECAKCHEDVHQQAFGTDCASCHHEESFRKVAHIENFNHALTGFALTGKHASVDCRKCHTESFTKPLPHQVCADCHSDYHDNQFADSRGGKPDCARCHHVENFAGSLFDPEAHQHTRFPLTGAHEATPCLACHLKANNARSVPSKWQFRNIGIRCADCHNDPHAGVLKPDFYPDHACDQCHNNTHWRRNIQFDHGRTAFALQGKHASLSCGACHQKTQEAQGPPFAGLPTQCAGCHSDPHAAQFVRDGRTDCGRCHGMEKWPIEHFNHDRTAFKLEGKHVGLACVQCHKKTIVQAQEVVQYKFEAVACTTCHK